MLQRGNGPCLEQPYFATMMMKRERIVCIRKSSVKLVCTCTGSNYCNCIMESRMCKFPWLGFFVGEVVDQMHNQM